MSIKSAVAALAASAALLRAAGAAEAPCLSSSAAWRNRAFPAQSAPFGAVFDATPAAGWIDGVTGLSSGAASGFSGLAVAVRFNNSGFIDARDGEAYGAANLVPYVAGAAYRFRLWVDPGARRYSVHVTPPGGAETPLALNFAFRGTAGPSSLDDWAAFSASGGLLVCGFRLVGGALPGADIAPPSAAITAPAPGAVVSGSVTITATASDDVGVAGVRLLVDGVPLGAELRAPPYAFVWNTAASPNGAHALTAAARDAAGNVGSATIAATVENGAPRR